MLYNKLKLIIKCRYYILQVGYGEFFISFSSPLCQGANEDPSLYQSLMITRLSTLVCPMWSLSSADPSCTGAGLSCSEQCRALLSQSLLSPSLFRAPSKYRGFVNCIAQEVLLPSSAVLRMQSTAGSSLLGPGFFFCCVGLLLSVS